jgi:hypothetical protein
MDEYDVFLDTPSRLLTLKNIQEYALSAQQSGRQFLIITPHDLSSIVTSSKVKVIRMTSPERTVSSGLQQQIIQ